MSRGGSTKIVNFMTPALGVEVVILRVLLKRGTENGTERKTE